MRTCPACYVTSQPTYMQLEQVLRFASQLACPYECSVLALLETTSFAISLAGPILIALVGFTIFAAEVRFCRAISFYCQQ